MYWSAFPHADYMLTEISQKPVGPSISFCYTYSTFPDTVVYSLPNNLLNPGVLQSPNLLPERLHLFPAIQRPPVILPQAPHHFPLGLLHVLIQVRQLLPLLQFLLQLLNIILYRLPAQLPQCVARRLLLLLC